MGRNTSADWTTRVQAPQSNRGYCKLWPFRGPWSRNLHGIALLLQVKVAFSNQTVSGHASTPWQSGDVAPRSRCLWRCMKHYGSRSRYSRSSSAAILYDYGGWIFQGESSVWDGEIVTKGEANSIGCLSNGAVLVVVQAYPR
jgi:hypothetical protein